MADETPMRLFRRTSPSRRGSQLPLDLLEKSVKEWVAGVKEPGPGLR